MNPLRWVRWKVVAVLAALGIVVYFLGLDRVALSQINSAGREKSNSETFMLGCLVLGV